jgi:hypothetical protein
VHPTGGSLRVFRQCAWLGVGSGKTALPRPTHPRVTHPVGHFLTNYKKEIFKLDKPLKDHALFPNLNINISTSWIVRVIYLVGIAFFLGMAVWVQISTQIIGIAVFFAAFALLEFLALLLSFSTLQINYESVVMTAFYGVYKINWDEVKTIETNGIIIALFGENKRFPMHLGMAGKERVEFSGFLENLIQQRQIEVKPLSSRWMTHKNTKIRRFEF